VGGLGDFVATHRPKSIQITDILKDAPNFISNTAFITVQGLTDKGDNLYFNTKAYRSLGQRYAKALQAMPTRSGPLQLSCKTYPFGPTSTFL